jgi:two-component system nitrate/nitrite response regulator NarL
LNVELLICDRCNGRFEMRLDDADGQHTGYGHVTVRNINARPVMDCKGRGLSAREKKVVDAVVAGKPTKTIARDLDCAEATVKVHLKSIMRKTGLKNRTQIAVLACNGNGHVDSENVQQAITADVEKSIDLCRQCLDGLGAYLANGKGDK